MQDAVSEADEMYQNAGEKGVKHADPEDSPRRRANKVKGHGTWDNDRLPVAGVVGRDSGEIRLAVCPTVIGRPSRPLSKVTIQASLWRPNIWAKRRKSDRKSHMREYRIWPIAWISRSRYHMCRFKAAMPE